MTLVIYNSNVQSFFANLIFNILSINMSHIKRHLQQHVFMPMTIVSYYPFAALDFHEEIWVLTRVTSA